MKKSSMRNLLAVLGLFAVALVAATGCPKAADNSGSKRPADAAAAEHQASESDAKTSDAAAPSGDQSGDQVAAAGDGHDAKTSASAHGKEKLDPIAVNGRYFVGWTKPKLALVFSGRQDGYLEPCGCAGLENQKGGLSRRHAMIKQLQAQGWPVSAVDVGSLVRRFGKQAELQFAHSADALRTMGYQAVGFGVDDLRLSGGELTVAVVGDDPEKSIFVSANVNVLGVTPQFRIFEAGGKKIGVTSILGEEFQKQINNTDVELKPVDAALAEVLPKLKDCDVRILLANATPDECRALAKKYSQFDFVVPGAGADEPPAEAIPVEGSKTQMIEVGHKGMFVVVLGFYDDPKQPVRYQRVALDSRFPNSPEMKRMMVNYQAELEELGWKGLGLRPSQHPRATKGEKLSGQFVGGASCKECHEPACDVYDASKHALATETLAKLDPPRQFDPECISCHATGWNPQEFFPYATGFESLAKTPHLAGNSCENCHGPGAAHVAAEKDSSANRDAQRELMKLTTATAKSDGCIKCHDLDNSPKFDFDKYWPDIEH